MLRSIVDNESMQRTTSKVDQYFCKFKKNYYNANNFQKTSQCDQIGLFFRLILATNFLTHVAQLFGGTFDAILKDIIKNKTSVITLWATFGHIWANLYTNICSHWLWHSWRSVWPLTP